MAKKITLRGIRLDASGGDGREINAIAGWAESELKGKNLTTFIARRLNDAIHDILVLDPKAQIYAAYAVKQVTTC